MRSFLVLLAVFAMVNLKGENPNSFDEIEKWIPIEAISGKIQEYFSTHNLTPFLHFFQGTSSPYLVNPAINAEDFFMTFLQMDFPQEQRETNALFSLRRDKHSEKFDVELLFVIRGQCISPELFLNILCSPALAISYPRATEFDSLHLQPKLRLQFCD